eukprot:5342142-Lingulodinium_polyedra.AAC.1
MLLRRHAALVLLAGCVVVQRWVPSELNAADGASRTFEAKGAQAGPAGGASSTTAAAASDGYPAGRAGARAGRWVPCAEPAEGPACCAAERA